jgi:hypothetical protein
MTVMRGSETNIGDSLPSDEIPKNVSPMIELGQTGLRRTSGYVNEEFLPQLRGRKAVQVYREMSENDPIVGALLYAVDRLLRQVEWRVEPADSTPEQKQAAEFIEQCMEDMSHTWDDMLTEICTMLPYGFSWHEIVYKKRVGPWEKNPKMRSKYNDNRIGWRKIPIRAQETMLRWVFDDHGGTQAMVQLAPPLYQTTVLPIEKSLLFRVSSAKGNPEGRSFLRNAYRPWFVKKRLEEIMLIGVERDLAGMPMARVPQDYLSAEKGTDKAVMVEAVRKMVRSVRRNEQEGIIIPRQMDQDTKTDLFDFELLSSGGSRQMDIAAIIDEYNLEILQSVLADFIKVGHEGTGSYSMHTDKTGLFRASINSIAQTIADTFNMYAIPRLFAVNGWKIDQLPQIVPSDVDPPDLAQLSTFMGQLATAGLTWFPDVELEKFLRKAANLPDLDEQSEKVKEQEERQADTMKLAQQQMEMLTMQQQAEQGQMQMDQMRHQTEIMPQQTDLQMKGQQMSLEQQKMQMEAPQTDPRLQQQRDDEVHQMTLAEKQQGMSQRDAEHKLNLTTKQKEAELKLKGLQESSKGNIKTQQMTSAQKIKHAEEKHKMGLKAKADASKKTPPKKEKK